MCVTLPDSVLTFVLGNETLNFPFLHFCVDDQLSDNEGLKKRIVFQVTLSNNPMHGSCLKSMLACCAVAVDRSAKISPTEPGSACTALTLNIVVVTISVASLARFRSSL